MKPLFIGGTGRCGTTILRDTLGCHPKIAALPAELRVIVDSNGFLDLYGNLTCRWGPYRSDYSVFKLEELLYQISSQRQDKYSGHRIDHLTDDRYFGLVKQLIKELVRYRTTGHWTGSEEGRQEIYEVDPFEQEGELREIFSTFFDKLFRIVKPEADYWVDDTPYSLLQADRIEQAFPDATLIHIHRHPYDVLASYNRIRTDSRRWTSESTMANAKRIRNIMETWWDKARKTDLECMEVRFESLMTDTGKTLQKICNLLGLSFTPRIIDASRIDPGRANLGRRNDPEQGLTPNEKMTVYESGIFDPIMRRYKYSVIEDLSHE